MLPDAFGCEVVNRFRDLLDDDVDPFDLMNEVETEKEKRKKKKKEEEEKKAKQKKLGQKESQKDRRLPVNLPAQEPQPVHRQVEVGPAPATGGGVGREPDQRGIKRAAAGQRQVKQDEPPLEFSTDRSSFNPDSDLRNKAGFRGRRGARGGRMRNQDDFNPRGKREYDRHNGTGISPEEKRGGRGPWNWGSVDDTATEIMEVTSEGSGKGEKPQTPNAPNQSCGQPEDNGEVVVEVAVEMSLDEWKATQEMKRAKAEFNIRKGEDKIPSKAKVIHQSKHLESSKVTMETEEDDGNFLRKSVNDITSLMNINFGSLGRPGRGGRGRGARGGQRANPVRVVEKDDLAPNPDDPEDFPALPTGNN